MSMRVQWRGKGSAPHLGGRKGRKDARHRTPDPKPWGREDRETKSNERIMAGLSGGDCRQPAFRSFYRKEEKEGRVAISREGKDREEPSNICWEFQEGTKVFSIVGRKVIKKTWEPHQSDL